MIKTEFDVRRRLVLQAAAAGAGALHLPRALAQPGGLPKGGQGKIVVPFPPGGPTDLLARILADGYQKLLDVSYVVENKPGVTGNLGAAQVAASPANGLNLLVTNSSVVLNPLLFKRTKVVDPFTELAPVSALGTTTFALAVPANTPEKTLDQWLERMKRGERGSYGSFGVGSASHLFGYDFASRHSLQLEHIPYKGDAPAMQDMLAGVLTCSFFAVGSAKPVYDSGRIKVLAVTGDERSKLFPDIPTFGELGIKGFETAGWLGLLAPAGTPIDTRRTIAAATTTILSSAEATSKLSAFGIILFGTTPERFAEMMKTELSAQAPRIKASGAALD